MISVSPSSYKRKARDLNPHDPKVARFSRPARRAVSGYLPYSFHRVESRGIEPRFPPCHSGVFPLDHDPVSGAPGNRTPITWVQAKCLPVRPASRISRGPSGNRTRSPSLPQTCAARTPTDHLLKVIADGIEPSISWLSPRRLRRWTTRSISDRGGRRTHKIATLST